MYCACGFLSLSFPLCLVLRQHLRRLRSFSHRPFATDEYELNPVTCIICNPLPHLPFRPLYISPSSDEDVGAIYDQTAGDAGGGERILFPKPIPEQQGEWWQWRRGRWSSWVWFEGRLFPDEQIK